jgi:ABC-type antimicrobial peptide transport system permease subunit
MDERVKRSMTRARTNLMLAGALASLGLVLAAVGLYGVLSFGVAQRLREFGVRLALGATPGAVGRSVLAEGLCLTGLGVAVGVVAGAVMIRAIGAVLYGTSAADLRQYALAAGVVLACSALAFWLPARRAAAADPLTVLRAD